MSSFPKHSYTEQALDHVFPQSNSDTGQAPAPAQGYRSERSPLITRAPIVNSTAARLDSFPSGHQSTNQLSPFDNNRNDSNNSNNNKYSKSHTLLDSEQPRGQLLQPQPRSYGTTRGQDEEQQQQSPTPTIIASSSDFLGPASSTPGMDKYTYQPGRLSVREVAIQEFKILLRYSWPVVLTYVLQNSLQLASLISLGHLGSIGECLFSFLICALQVQVYFRHLSSWCGFFVFFLPSFLPSFFLSSPFVSMHLYFPLWPQTQLVFF